ncbi:MAG: ABC transporter ATP-binding protein [Lachnospiraceae bacterium]|nr:ABC transporter ATP-binding protein [Lachnospiraceae bacterium]
MENQFQTKEFQTKDDKQLDQNAIMIANVSHRFGDKEVLKNISLSVKKGEIIGLLGPSGAGKTTLIKIITGQLVPTSGSVELTGCDMRNPGPAIYRRIGMMMDDCGLYERLSCYDNLRLYADLYRIGHDRIGEVLKWVGLYEDRKCPAQKLSKGMRGRLMLARAVLHRPEFLFLDEPTSGLDPATTGHIHELIFGMCKEGTTVFLTTHNMTEAEKLCKHVALLHEGKIVEYGEPQEINRKYNHMNRLRIRLYSGKDLDLPNTEEAAAQIYEYLQSRQIETIHSTEPNLESVFLELTGQRLQE